MLRLRDGTLARLADGGWLLTGAHVRRCALDQRARAAVVALLNGASRSESGCAVAVGLWLALARIGRLLHDPRP
jgi:hypothetical protein